jgi:hypothetical protein
MTEEKPKKPSKLRLLGGESSGPEHVDLIEGNSDVFLSVSLLALCAKRLNADDLRELNTKIRSILPEYVRSVSFRVERLNVADLHQTIHPGVKG